jgi:hypothetical protein
MTEWWDDQTPPIGTEDEIKNEWYVYSFLFDPQSRPYSFNTFILDWFYLNL